MTDREMAMEKARRMAMHFSVWRTGSKGFGAQVENAIADALLEAEARGAERAAEQIAALQPSGREFTSTVQLAFVLALNSEASRLRTLKTARRERCGFGNG